MLRSDAPLQDKSAACRQLARVATKDAVPTLAALLGDEKLSHMARYALETIRDPSVDDALRDALGKVQGRTAAGRDRQSGCRRDAKAIDALAELLQGTETAQAAARALGNIGTAAAAKALEDALSGRIKRQANWPSAKDFFAAPRHWQRKVKLRLRKRIYDRLRGLADAPQQVRAAALRGAILARGKDGIPLLVEAIHGTDYALAAAAVRSAMELPGRGDH